MASVTGCLLVVMAVTLLKVSAADTYTVGDSLGWTLPPAGNVAYSTWARTKSFDIGDVIVFQWSGNHNVAEVSKADYDSCNTTNPINGTIYQTSPASITLTTNNTRYFICTVTDHCKSFGQKVTISMEQKWWDDSASSFRNIGAFFAFSLATFVTFFLNY
ncbi:Phytocyanin domain containing protein [Trema orientale]|uniref:Phytocyanin domain containing protein n=1 Tax=Trema orientale TaxID=63057 RepID=A0A2P5F903_TREOI|nr:Phytocyanin domain containing protein [Trema orientale]